jgi:hypothetical protein
MTYHYRYTPLNQSRSRPKIRDKKYVSDFDANSMYINRYKNK